MKKFLFSQNSREKVRSKINVKEDEILIGHIGRFAKAKNHKFIIDLLKILVSKKLKIKISIDGGINDEIAKRLDFVDIIVSGSYVINGDNYNEKIETLRRNSDINKK